MKSPTELQVGGLRVRSYGTSGPRVIVIHGGPGAAGSMAPVARELADEFQILEPFQRGSGSERLTVARHVADLHELIVTSSCGGQPVLIGSSWGAMLALSYAAAHAYRAHPLVLIGCGTFDRSSRQQFQTVLDGRMHDALRHRLQGLGQEFPDADERLKTMADLVLPLYSFDLFSMNQEVEVCDARAHHETWSDMVRLQAEGIYPAAFADITGPVLMLHGRHDPHPGPMIRDSLAPYLPQLEYQEWSHCSHFPWLERNVRATFFCTLRSWLRGKADLIAE